MLCCRCPLSNCIQHASASPVQSVYSLAQWLKAEGVVARNGRAHHSILESVWYHYMPTAHALLYYDTLLYTSIYMSGVAFAALLVVVMLLFSLGAEKLLTLAELSALFGHGAWHLDFCGPRSC